MAAPVVEDEPGRRGMDARALARAQDLLERYVTSGALPGYHLVVARQGSVVQSVTGGLRDVDAGLPVTGDTLWRIYSMTKPITSVVVMQLVEEGTLQLTDPVSRFIPSFTDQRVFVNGSDLKMVTAPAAEPVRIKHLLTHTSGLTYGFHRSHPVETVLRDLGYEWGCPPDVDLAGAVDAWAALPLLFTPGSAYTYSLATDVLGRVIEVVTGRSLDTVFAERVTGPLGMSDTGFRVSPEDAGRLVRLYTPGPDGGLTANDELGGMALDPPMLSGGGGLVSTAADYHRFVQMLAHGGELDGVRILGPRTLALMTRNHLPGNADLDTYGRPVFAEIPQRGVGFGLGFAVVIDAAATGYTTSAGEFNWGGAASTHFWVDPVEDLTVVLMTSLLPSSTYPLRPQLRNIIYGALR